MALKVIRFVMHIKNPIWHLIVVRKTQVLHKIPLYNTKKEKTKCVYKECDTRANYNYVDRSIKLCNTHKLKGMIGELNIFKAIWKNFFFTVKKKKI